jgi:hypothetical protein
MATKSDKIFFGLSVDSFDTEDGDRHCPRNVGNFEPTRLIFREDFISISETGPVSEKFCLKKKRQWAMSQVIVMFDVTQHCQNPFDSSVW